MNIGDLYWVEFPARGGHAQAGRRPAIIAQTPSTLPTVLLVPLTSQLDALRFPGTVLVETSQGNGLRHHSVALVFQLTAIDKRYISEPLGKASDAVLAQLWSALDALTGRG